jgi:hypothetical protein
LATANVTLVAGGGTYAAAAGSDRIVVIALAREGAGATPTVATLSWGASTLANGRIVEAASVSKFAASPRGTAYIWYVKEADIESGAQTLQASWANAMNGTNDFFTCYTLTGRDQASPVYATNSAIVDATSTSWALTLVSEEAADLVMSAWNSTSGTSFNAPVSPWTWIEDQDIADVDYRTWQGHVDDVAAGSVDCTLSLGTARVGSVVVAAFSEGTAPPPSGGSRIGSLLNAGLN